ncbi:hypothetical protein [Spiroplasma citri]|uniref:Uncharacterized protein n=1 Tax=Spiroplasma citri TaxID=2133 RepID=A0AAJ4EIP5_SPICI|nr:hypothetical protein [Spiroplasma citri]APE74413.1 hypothetical protein SCITRI_00510 [Spiroplasma citri]QED24347.1 hypothetical protein FRX96_02395 [Spiroplasma citri]QIA66612.1 hypothetical protein GMI18_02390 [Spiroplasma citri]QIA68495.1 hypothetical protein GL298_02510 [Spiroplasma citri]QIA70371.1 hypothetical protein GL981_02515 [Spiroplasma citri]
MATWLIITLTIIVLFLVLFGGFIFFMYKDWNNNIKSAEETKLKKVKIKVNHNFYFYFRIILFGETKNSCN